MLKGKYRVNESGCNPGQEHVWSKTEVALVSLCLKCFKPKLVLR